MYSVWVVLTFNTTLTHTYIIHSYTEDCGVCVGFLGKHIAKIVLNGSCV